MHVIQTKSLQVSDTCRPIHTTCQCLSMRRLLVRNTPEACIMNQLRYDSSDKNNMRINSVKTKEMILGNATKNDWPSLTIIHGTPLERVYVYKLLGVFISADLRWKTC